MVLGSEGGRKSGVVLSGNMGIVRGRGGSPVPRLIASGLACMRNEQVIIRDVNMTPHEGSGLIITGPNASGKSTFLRVVRISRLPPRITGNVFFPPFSLSLSLSLSLFCHSLSCKRSFDLFLVRRKKRFFKLWSLCQKQENDSSTVVGY